MGTSTDNSSERYWKSQAHNFSNLYKDNEHFSLTKTILSSFLRARTKVLDTFMPLPLSKDMLDVGCGSGIHIARYAPLCRSIIGVDYSQQMLDEAKNLLQKCKKNNWKLIRADASHMPIRSGTIDIAYAMGLIDYVPSPKDLCMEIRRLLKTKGIFIVSIPKRPSIFSFLRTPVGNWIKKTIFHLPHIDNTMSEKMITELFTSTGFSIQEKTSVWSAMWIVKALKK